MRPNRFSTTRLPLLACSALILGGCLSDDESASVDEPTSVTFDVSGSVGDGPIIDADMQVLGADDALLAQFRSDGSAGYRISLNAATAQLPLRVTATGGTDLVTGLAPDFVMQSALFASNRDATVNVNPFTTLAVEASRDMGGLSQSSYDSAIDIVVRELNGGLSSLANGGVTTQPVGSSNIAEIVRASESVGELIRRVRDELNNAGFATDGDAVLASLASDLTDGVVDGRGGSRADARVAALANLLSAQVLVETLRGELRVNGVNAMATIDAAIVQVSPAPPSPTLDELGATQAMLQSTRVGLVAAHAVSSNDELIALLDSATGIQVGMDSGLVRALLPARAATVVGDSVALVAAGNDSMFEVVNRVARDRQTTISGGNRPPSIAGTPASMVSVGNAYAFTPSATDPDGDALSFSVSGLPGWASFDTGTGALTGTPAAGDVGNYDDIAISVSDGEAEASLAAFSISVQASNMAPSISGDPATSVAAGVAYEFTPTAADPDGDTLTFSIQRMPRWASFDSATGRLSGTPAQADAGNYTNIRIGVTDGELTANLPAFAITVNGSVNGAPGISGNPPASVVAGTAYTFTPQASDPDNDTLSFTAVNLPAWASFSTATGQISGTPQAGDIGNYNGIRITVSDGMASDELGPFSIEVLAVTLGSVTLSWTPPTTNSDGSPLNDLAGYRIYWGNGGGSYPQSVTINNPSVSSYVVENLAPGDYEFVATALNAAGFESEFSSPATRTVQ
ncbi:MAG: putative Ig domain-containing protein [Pseudomonadota bacterium]